MIATRVPAVAWRMVAAGMAINLCLGILYAWSVWKANLVANVNHPAGSAMIGLNEGWSYLSDTESTLAYSICGLTFAICMVPGGYVQDRFGPRTGTIVGGLLLGGGCILAGLLKNYIGLVVGFGLMGGMGMGLGYAAATPAAVRWFGSSRRGLVVGLIVGGYGGAAIYISPLAKYLIGEYGLSTSFIALGIWFAGVIITAGWLLKMPPTGYSPPVPLPSPNQVANTKMEWSPTMVLRSRQLPLLVLIFIGGAQAGLLVIVNATPILNDTAKAIPFLMLNGWVLASYSGLVNSSGRIGTGFYSDTLGRINAFGLNGIASIVALLLLPTIIAEQNVWLLFLAVGVTIWQYGGTLSLMPALTADYFGSRFLGVNYGLVFLGWGVAFLVPLAGSYLKTATDDPTLIYYVSAAMLAAAVLASRFLRRPER